MTTREIRLGADIGGTFTDVALDLRGQLFSTKVLTNYTAPEQAILDGIEIVTKQAGIVFSDLDIVIHGTTLATNSLIERRGAKTALVTTEGFRDVIEMRTENRFDQYDLNLVLPTPLIPRQHRFPIAGRLDAQGHELLALDEARLEALSDELAAEGFEAIAIGFIHSYQNPAHEERARDILAAKLPGIPISISAEVSPQMREFERLNTVCANAYVRPQMQDYLTRLQSRLKEQGAHCPVFMIHSGGGLISVDTAIAFPVRLVESGPAGGAIFAADVAARFDLEKVVSFDMGGTTAKICLIKNQTPKTSRVFEVARTYRFKKGSGMPISIPVIDMVEIGAGGGSLAHVDGMRQIRVGPESAGSEPGPACYGRGGDKPAVTDADLILGKLNYRDFAGGTMTLDRDAAKAAIKSVLADPLEMDMRTAAFGLSEVVDENMANAARVHAVENGEDLSEYTMIAFGGAAPLHAGRLCEKLGVERLLVPPGAGVGSAIGFLRAPFSFEANKSVYMKLSDFDGARIKTLLADLQTEATGFVRNCDADAPILSEFKVYMRYTGQGWEIPIVLSAQQATTPDAATFEQLFEDEYSKLFGRTVTGLDIEITVWSVNATTPTDTVARVAENDGTKTAVVTGKCRIFDAAQGRVIGCYRYHRSRLKPGYRAKGPAMITEDETTIIVPHSRNAVGQPDGCIDITPKAKD